MPKTYKITYLPIAQSDLIEIFDYVLKDNPNSATKFLNEIEKSIAKLENFSKLGNHSKDERLKALGYRILIVKKFLIFYICKEEHIEIRRILHGSRKYSFLL